jgi:hypothetical protein
MLLEVRHNVSDGGCAELGLEVLGNVTGADRDRALDVVMNDHPEDALFSVVQRGRYVLALLHHGKDLENLIKIAKIRP